MKHSYLDLFLGVILAGSLCTLGCGTTKPSISPTLEKPSGTNRITLNPGSDKNSQTFTIKYAMKDGKMESVVEPGGKSMPGHESDSGSSKGPPLLNVQMASKRPPGAVVDESFLKLSDDEKISQLIPVILRNQSPDSMAEVMRKAGKEQEYHGLLVKMVAMDDPRMATETFETETIYTADGSTQEKKVNQRVDDSLFKEFVLYAIRDSLPPDSPHLKGLFEAFWKETKPWTRMRIVRAAGKIGGPQVQVFLREVVSKEAGLRTLAAQEAARRLK